MLGLALLVSTSTCQVQYKRSKQLQIAVVVVKSELNPRSLARGDRDIMPHLMRIHKRRIGGLGFRVRIQTKLWALVHWGACDQHRKVGAFGAGIPTGVTVVWTALQRPQSRRDSTRLRIARPSVGPVPQTCQAAAFRLHSAYTDAARTAAQASARQ